MFKKIAIITGTRADYGLLKPLIRAIENHSIFELHLIASAMHLSHEFGYTVSEIEEDGFTIAKKIDCALNSDTASGVTKSIAAAAIGFADAFEDLNPDLVIVLGDRSEIFAAATAAMIFGIPIAHIHGGETTEGAYDEGIRHSITKMSYLHFASTETYRKRIIQLGEDPSRVFNVGAIGLDSIKNLTLLSKNDLEKSIDQQLFEKNVLITFHPVTMEDNSAEYQFEQLLSALDKIKDTLLIFTFANSDKQGRIINQMIESYVDRNKHKACAFKSLGQMRYLSCVQFIDCVIGNSSSGIIEVPYFKKPTINIGDRQRGRIAPISVIHVSNDQAQIEAALEKAFSPNFLASLNSMDQLYGNGNTTAQIMSVLESTTQVELKKSFFDLNT